MRKTFGRVRSSSSDSQHPATPLLDRYKDISDNGIVVNFTVNGDDIHYDGPDMRLLPFLRNNLRLTGVKDGCSEGRAGHVPSSSTERRRSPASFPFPVWKGSISPPSKAFRRGKNVYGFCFAESGAVQCGFCTPGMIMSIKALIDTNPAPTEIDVRKAIHGNICRCTGYKKIIEAALMSARYLRERIPVERKVEIPVVDERYRRVDAEGKHWESECTQTI